MEHVEVLCNARSRPLRASGRRTRRGCDPAKSLSYRRTRDDRRLGVTGSRWGGASPFAGASDAPAGRSRVAPTNLRSSGIPRVTAQAQLEHLVDTGVFDTGEGRELLEARPHLADADLDALRALPDATLGREWVRFLDDHGLDPSLTKQPTPFTEDDRCAYLMHRIRQSHDLWHVLIGASASRL